MVKCLFWKEKVVRSFAILVISLSIYQQALPQSSAQTLQQPKFSLSCNALHFQDVIKQLEKMTGVHFVYSTNKIQTNKRISLTVSEKPLDEILRLLERQTNLVFKRKDQHVVIKTADENLPDANQPQQQLKSIATKSPNTNNERPLERLYSVEDKFTLKPGLQSTLRYPTTLLGDNYLKNDYKDLSLYFDTTMLAGLARNDLQHINIKDNHKGWFISSGFVINDYSMGAEFQAGLRSIYFVYSPTWLKDARMHSAYGLGTSIPVNKNISLNIVYAYAPLKGKEYSIVKTENQINSKDLTYSANHHQIKLMMQYAFTRNINLRTGITINRMVTTLHLPKDAAILINDRNINTSPSGTYLMTSFAEESLPEVQPTEMTIKKFDMWMSWEATVSYKINFEKR